MYGIPEDFELTPLVGEDIQQISIGPNTMHIDFSNGWTLGCEGIVEIQAKGKWII
ncbi:MAG: hypothetical protein ACYS0I_13930 [Planctomycetota bacterium]|jgi:hypothetical protein